MAILLGITCGLLGLIDLMGPLYYIIGMFATNIVITTIVINTPRNQDVIDVMMPANSFTLFQGVTDQVWSFLFLWVLAYNAFHVY
jgi:hypothetical protein